MRFKIIVVSIILSIPFIFSGRAIGSSKVRFYNDLFNNLDMPVYFSDANEFKLSRIGVSEEGLEKDSAFAGTVPYLILFSSEFDESQLAKSDKVIVICDTPFSFAGFFSCDLNSVKGYAGPVIDIYVDDIIEVKVFEGVRGDRKFVVVPEVSFFSISHREKLDEYFKALLHADKVSCESCGGEKLHGKGGKGAINDFFESSVDGAVGYLLVLVLSGLFLRGLLVNLIKKGKFVDTSSLGNVYDTIVDFYNKSSWLTVYLIVLSLFLYVPLTFIVSFRDKGFFSFKYVLIYTLNTFDFQILNVDLAKQGVFRLFYLFYNLGFIILVIFFLFPYIISFVGKSVKEISRRIISIKAAKFIVAVSLFTSVILLVVFKVEDLYALIVLLLLGLLYVGYLLKRQGVDLGAIFSMKEKVFYSLVFILLMMVSLVYENDIRGRIYTSKFKNLIGISDSVVMLPYDKRHDERVLFKDFYVKVDFPIFVDDYLLYHPDFEVIENKGISEFVDEGSYLVLSGTKRGMVEFFFGSELVREKITRNEFSEFFYLSNFEFDSSSEYQVGLTFNCRSEISGNKLSLRSYSLSGGERLDIEEDKFGLMRFPGCGPGWRDFLTYEIPFKAKKISNGMVVFVLEGAPAGLVSNVEILQDGRVLPHEYIKFPSDREVLFSVYKGGSSLRVYSFNLEQTYTLDNRDGEKGVNISGSINELKLNGLLSNPFRIWTSTAENRIIRNNLIK